MALTISVASSIPKRPKADGAVRIFSQDLPKEIRETLKQRNFKGDWGTAELLVAPGGGQEKFLGVIGLGTMGDRSEALRRGFAKVVLDAQQHALQSFVLDLRGEDDALRLAAAAVEAARFITYAFSEHKKTLAKQMRARALRSLAIVVDKKVVDSVETSVREAQQIMNAVNITRDLVSQPASHLKPKALVEAAKEIADGKIVTLKIMNRHQAAADNWNAFLAVASGSAEEPYVIHLTYKPENAVKKIALVGKGITFDSGGLSLKPADKMGDMKIDMAGAATVLGVFAALKKLQLPVEVHGIIATCENMPSGSAYRPGDILHARSGKTIEVANTDAEGRVTLADALDYAVQQKPDAIIDLATLTGACMIALGETYAGLFSNDKPLNDALMTAAKQAGEGLEDLPLPEEYKQHVESPVADLTNAPMNHPLGGAITAALFLREFVGKTPWAHIDLAGPVYMEKPILPYWQFGGTGYGVRTLLEFLKRV